MGAVVLVLGLSGPFGTFDAFRIGPRLVYWAVMAVASFAVGNFFGTWTNFLLEEKKLPRLLRVLLVGLGAGIPVAGGVILLNLLAVTSIFQSPADMAVLAAYCIGISIAIAALLSLFGPHDNNGESTAEAGTAAGVPARAAIVEQLPVEKRGDLISLSVQDHYVEVVTGRGRHLLLMRLGDAIEKTAPVTGLQIHRSHWVALEQIQKTRREKGKVLVTTMAGDVLPVSRTFRAAARDAGLLN